jgi:hypothetical protein
MFNGNLFDANPRPPSVHLPPPSSFFSRLSQLPILFVRSRPLVVTQNVSGFMFRKINSRPEIAQGHESALRFIWTQIAISTCILEVTILEKSQQFFFQQDRTPDMRRSARKNLIFRNLTGFSSQYRYRISTGTPVKIRVYTCVHSCVCVHIPLYLSRYIGRHTWSKRLLILNSILYSCETSK